MAGLHGRDSHMATVALVVLFFITPGILMGMASSWRAGFRSANIVRDARYWLVAWLLLVCMAVVL